MSLECNFKKESLIFWQQFVNFKPSISQKLKQLMSAFNAANETKASFSVEGVVTNSFHVVTTDQIIQF